jgi:hypothetical protein
MKSAPPLNLLPSSIRILHKKFALVERTPQQFMADNRLAEINFVEAEINYLPLPGTETVDSIVHEVLHGVWKMMDLGLEDEEEHVVTALATGLTTVLRDNPTLFPKLQELVNKD